MTQCEIDDQHPTYPSASVLEISNHHPHPFRRRNFVAIHPRQEQVQVTTKICDNCKWSCTTLLSLCVAFINILASAYIASHSSGIITGFFAVAAITINILLCYGAIFSRKETIITWLVFYGLLSLILVSCFTPKHVKVTENPQI